MLVSCCSCEIEDSLRQACLQQAELREPREPSPISDPGTIQLEPPGPASAPITAALGKLDQSEKQPTI